MRTQIEQSKQMATDTYHLLKQWKGNWPSWFTSSSPHPAWLRKQTKACIKQMKQAEERLYETWSKPIQRVVDQAISGWASILSAMPDSHTWSTYLANDWSYRYMESMRQEVKQVTRLYQTETQLRDEVRAIVNRRIRSLPAFVPYLLHDVKQKTVFRLMEINQVSHKEWHTHHCSSPFCSTLAYARRERDEAFLMEGEMIQAGIQALRIERNILYPPLYSRCRCEIVPVIKERSQPK
jgi:hypothetical protein